MSENEINVSLDYLISKGAVKSCSLHDENKIIYFDSQEECPICKAIKEVKKPVAKRRSKKEEPELTAPVVESVPSYKKGQRIGEGYGKNDAIDKVVEWWNGMPTVRKILFTTIVVLIVWLLSNVPALMSYM